MLFFWCVFSNRNKRCATKDFKSRTNTKNQIHWNSSSACFLWRERERSTDRQRGRGRDRQTVTDNDRGTQTDKNRDWDTDGKQTSKQTEQAYSGFERSRKRYGLTTCTKACIQTLNTVHCADGTPPPPTPRHPPHRTPSNHLSHTIFANETTYYGCGNTSRTIRNKAERPHSHAPTGGQSNNAATPQHPGRRKNTAGSTTQSN